MIKFIDLKVLNQNLIYYLVKNILILLIFKINLISSNKT